MNDTDRLDEIDERLANATPGPWIESANLHPDGSMDYGIATEHDEADVCTFPHTPQGSEDMELVAHARDDLAALVKFAREVEALHQPIAHGRDAITGEEFVTCVHCLETGRTPEGTRWDFRWPCPTAAAVQKLGSES